MSIHSIYENSPRQKVVKLCEYREQYQYLFGIMHTDRGNCTTAEHHEHNANRAGIVREELEEMLCPDAGMDDYANVQRLLGLSGRYIFETNAAKNYTVIPNDVVTIKGVVYNYQVSPNKEVVTVYTGVTPFAQAIDSTWEDCTYINYFNPVGHSYATGTQRFDFVTSSYDTVRWLVGSHPCNYFD